MEEGKGEKEKAVERSKQEEENSGNEEEDDDDCYLLDPNDCFRKLRISDPSDDDVILIAEKGPGSPTSKASVRKLSLQHHCSLRRTPRVPAGVKSFSLLQAPATIMEEERGEKEKAIERSKQEEEDSGDEEEEEDDDCYLLDPNDCFRKLRISDSSDDDVIIIAEKGPLALRDFPHPRHLCANFPFSTTAHASYCSKCFCYVCEVPAPCLQWDGTEGHCHTCTKENPQKPPL